MKTTDMVVFSNTISDAFTKVGRSFEDITRTMEKQFASICTRIVKDSDGRNKTK